jgi:hypothetical protein
VKELLQLEALECDQYNSLYLNRSFVSFKYALVAVTAGGGGVWMQMGAKWGLKSVLDSNGNAALNI